MFSEDQLEQLRSFPEISRDELIRYFTPATGDVAFVDTGRGRGAADRLGMLVQLKKFPTDIPLTCDNEGFADSR